MNFAKMAVIFVVGVAVGAVGGGIAGHRLGSTNRAIERAPVAGMVEAQPEPVRPPRRTAQTQEAPETVVEAPEETPDIPDTAEEIDATAAGDITAEEEAVQPEEADAVIEEFEITPNDFSEIMWVGYKSLLGQRLSMEGGFANFEGLIVVEDENPDESYVEVIIDMDMLFSENAVLTTVLRGDHFFDVEEFPKARFASTEIEPTEQGYLVTGNFTMKGVTQGIQFPAVIERRPNGVYVSAEFTINRKLWDVGYDAYEDSLILEEVVISFEVLAEPAD